MTMCERFLKMEITFSCVDHQGCFLWYGSMESLESLQPGGRRSFMAEYPLHGSTPGLMLT